MKEGTRKQREIARGHLESAAKIRGGVATAPTSRMTSFAPLAPAWRIVLQWMALAIPVLALTTLTGCADLPTDSAPAHGAVAPAPVSAPSEVPATQPADPAWPDVAKALERPGIVKDGIDVFTIPRDDLDVTIDGMGIPTGAGIASVFYFYRCPCGKMNVAGQFVVADYEANDVVDALRKNAAMSVASVSPLLLYARPVLLVVRFQGEGDPAVMAGILREALRWTGKERMAPEPLPKTPRRE